MPCSPMPAVLTQAALSRPELYNTAHSVMKATTANSITLRSGTLAYAA